jgi:hypothetical protein
LTQESLAPRQLAKEKIEILDGACKPRKLVVTRHGIDHDVSALLKRGLTTTSAGGFFFIPYLIQLMGFETIVGRQPNGIKPKLGLISAGLNVNVRRFVPFITEEHESVTTHS